MILSEKKFNFNYVLLTNIVFGFFPISFILGNLIININILLFCCLGIFHLKSKILSLEFDLVLKIIFLFFFAIFFSTILSLIQSFYFQEYTSQDLSRLAKSVAFFRFFLFLTIAYELSKLGILNFSFFFTLAVCAPLLTSIDIIFQYIFGFDLLGIEKTEKRYHSGFFGEELIAGGFINRFSFFSILLFPFIFKIKEKFSFLITILIISILGTGILLSGNRMPLILFFLGLVLIFLIGRNLRKKVATGFVSLFIIFGLLKSFDQQINLSFFNHFFPKAKNIVVKIFGDKEIFKKRVSQPTLKNFDSLDGTKDKYRVPESVLDIRNQNKDTVNFIKVPSWKSGELLNDDFEFFWVMQDGESGHEKIFLTAIDVWNKNKAFGNGIKSFREDCKKFFIHKKNRLCSNHPHNYYLEILTDTGILGFFIIFVISLLFIYFFFKKIRFFNKNNKESLILLSVVVSIILEAFPLKSTGSIFSTGNMTYIILIISILLSYKKILSDKNVLN
jgi:O-antigen ligase